MGVAPFISPLGLTMTPALSSKYMKTPSFRLQGFLWRTTTAGSTALTQSQVHTLVSPSHTGQRLSSHCQAFVSKGSNSIIHELQLS